MAEAEPLYQRALAIVEKALGPHHPQVAVTLSNLAELLRAATDSGRRPTALQTGGKRINGLSLHPNHPNVAISLNNLAESLSGTNQLTEAELLYRRRWRSTRRRLALTTLLSPLASTVWLSCSGPPTG